MPKIYPAKIVPTNPPSPPGKRARGYFILGPGVRVRENMNHSPSSERKKDKDGLPELTVVRTT